MRKYLKVLFAISKYLDEKTTGISTRLGVKRKSKLDQYINYIDKLIEIGVTSKTIYSKIKEMGYTGSESLIRNYKAKNKILRLENIKLN